MTAGCTQSRNSAPASAALQPGTTGSRSTSGSRGTDGGVRLRDVAQAAGLDYRWTIPGKRPFNLLQTIGNGCACLDYNNDNNLDILLVGSRLALYRGDGRRRFRDVTREVGLSALRGHFLGCAVGDYDNDGYDDLYISGYRTGVLLHNEQGRGFRDVTRQAGLKPQPWGTSCAFADVDGSGRLSLYISNYVVFGPDTQPKLCNHNGHMGTCGPTFYKPEYGVLYLNAGAGRFRDMTSLWGARHISGKTLGAAFADYNGAGWQSLALANDEAAGNLLHNAKAHFTDVAAAAGTAYDANGNAYGGMGLDWGDYDNDGRLDLAVATFSHEPKCIYHNEGGGVFEDRSLTLGIGKTPYVAFGEKWLDLDNDGWLDLIISNGHIQDDIHQVDPSLTYREPTQVFHNEGGGRFTDISVSAGPDVTRPLVGRGLAIGDFDNDGLVDALVVDSEGKPLLLHNETKDAGHWLMLKLVGTTSNSDAIGAVVTVHAGPLTLVRRCGTDGSYMSASDCRVHVGLGNDDSASVAVRWPTGKTISYGTVPANRFLTLREAATQVGTVPATRPPA